MTKEYFFNQMSKLLPDIEVLEVLGDYVDGKTKIKCRCKKCGDIHESMPYTLVKHKTVNDYGCYKCRPNKNKKLLTHEQFMKNIDGVVNPTIEIIGQYTGYKNKIKCRCKLCNQEIDLCVNTIKTGGGCPKCQHEIGFQKRRLSIEEFNKRFNEIPRNYELIGQYKNWNTKILCKCKVCGYEQERTPATILKTTDCAICSNAKIHDRQKITTEIFIKKLAEINSNIKVVGEYYNNSTKIKCYCMDCKQYFDAIPRNLTNRGVCPLCATSRGEAQIKKWLTDNNIPFIKEKTFPDLIGLGGGKLRYDFYIPDLSLIIEYNGIQHEEPVDFGGKGNQIASTQFLKQKQHDIIKREYAKANNIKLIEIWKKDIKNIPNILDEHIIKQGELIPKGR